MRMTVLLHVVNAAAPAVSLSICLVSYSSCQHSGEHDCHLRVMTHDARLPMFDYCMRLQAMQTRRYAGVGIMSQDFQLGKDGVISSLVSSACGRLNHIFKKQGMKMRFGIHPGKHTSYMQVWFAYQSRL